MSILFTWSVHRSIEPLSTPDRAVRLGVELAASIVIGYHVAVPVDGTGHTDRLVVLTRTPTRLLDHGRHLCDRMLWSTSPAHRRLILYSRRFHDIADDRDGDDSRLLASWLTTEGVQLVDWFILTRRSARSIPAEFGLARGW